MNQAALESRSIQSLIDKTSIPEAKMYVGGVRSTQEERICPVRHGIGPATFMVSLSSHSADMTCHGGWRPTLNHQSSPVLHLAPQNVLVILGTKRRWPFNDDPSCHRRNYGTTFTSQGEHRSGLAGQNIRWRPSGPIPGCPRRGPWLM